MSDRSPLGGRERYGACDDVAPGSRSPRCTRYGRYVLRKQTEARNESSGLSVYQKGLCGVARSRSLGGLQAQLLVVTKSAGSASACRQKLRPLPCSSSPNRTRYAGLRLGLVYHGQRVIHHQRIFPAVPIPALAEMGAP